MKRESDQWKELDSPVKQKVTSESIAILTETGRIPVPVFPGVPLYNIGNYVVRLGHVVNWLGQVAEQQGVEIYPGYAASEVLYNEDGSVKGIATNDVGIGKDGGLRARHGAPRQVHHFCRGCRGHLTKQVTDRFKLQTHPMSYGLGIKELWQIDPAKHRPGYIEHTMGWPMSSDSYGGSFLYHIEDNGQPLGGQRIGYGARAINEGGYQGVPKLSFPGGCLVGCTAGLLNVAKLKGTHNAMKSGMVAAESIYKEIGTNPEKSSIEPASYPKALEDTYVMKELRATRNDTSGGLAYTGLFYVLGRGLEPWTLDHGKPDNEKLLPKDKAKPIDYNKKADNKLTFDLLNSVSLTGTNHQEDQPSHLTLKDDKAPLDINLKQFDGPESRFCPAGVYEFVPSETASDQMRLQINAQNCIHCKTCDIKDPSQNINWVTPQGGEGPKYDGM
ncbi:unnamed protein product, partial [Mesorhabditis spiculigera]